MGYKSLSLFSILQMCFLLNILIYLTVLLLIYPELAAEIIWLL